MVFTTLAWIAVGGFAITVLGLTVAIVSQARQR